MQLGLIKRRPNGTCNNGYRIKSNNQTPENFQGNLGDTEPGDQLVLRRKVDVQMLAHDRGEEFWLLWADFPNEVLTW